jgi:hypothetical protein
LLARRNTGEGTQTGITILFFVVGLFLAREVGSEIAANNMGLLEMGAIGVLFGALAIAILRNWRLGFYCFSIWLLFEDLVRKYMGNGLALFFGKDILALVIYVSLFLAIRRHEEKAFNPPLLLWFPLSLFVWLGTAQIFNPNSASILYGLLGFKLDFFYIPMLFVGYAFIRNREDLRKFLVLNAALAIVISGVGVAQAILGNTFLNPATLAPELLELGNLEKVTPISGQVFSLPASVFVSAGRFGLYLALAATLTIGAAGFLLLYSKRNRRLVLIAIGAIGAATLLSGSRTAVVDVIASACILTVGLLWGAPWKWRQGHRMIKAIRWSVTVTALGLALAVLLFPASVGSRLAFYSETLNPYSSASAVTDRGWTYPVENFLKSFENPNWVWGNGLGTASLGTQYVARVLHTPLRTVWTEEGYGELILEMGICAPIIWIVWSACLLICCWKIVRRLRQTDLSPVAFAIFWYAFVLLYPLTFGGTTAYQNYVNNVFLWLLVGMLFRLPEIASAPAQALEESSLARGRKMARGWFSRDRARGIPALAGEKLT